MPTADAEQVRRIADQVLARPEFAGAQPSWWQRFLRVVGDFISRILETVGGQGRGSVIGTAAVLVLALLLTVVVLRYTRTLRRDPHRDLALSGQLGRSSRDWLAEAAAHEQEQRWRDAVRCRYRALLADLAAEGLVDEIAGRTSGEYLTVVREDVPKAAPAFADATRHFEAAWYGQAPVTGADVEAFAAAARSALAAAGARRVLASSPA